MAGLTSSYNIENVIKESAKLKNVQNIKDVKIPIAMPTTDLIEEREIIFTNSERLQGDEYIKDIEIGKAVRASSCFPGMYAPFEYEKFQFVDGGIFDNLPVEQVKKMTDSKVIAVKFKNKPARKQKTLYNIAMHALDLMNESIIKDSLSQSDYVLEVDLKDVKPFNISKIDFCYKEGYIQTIDNITKIKKLLE